VTLTNTGSAPLTIYGIATDPGVFAQLNDCPIPSATLAPSASCTINVTFTPTTPGAVVGTLSITDDAPGSPHVVTLSGTGIQPQMGALPAGLAFGDQVLNSTSPPQTVTVSNSGTADLTIASVAVTGTDASDFAKSADTCTGATLAPSGTCTVSVTFTPSATGARTASLVITSDAPGSPHMVALSGKGTLVGVLVTLSPTSLAFGNQRVGTTSAPQTVTYGLLTGTVLNITSIVASGDFAQTNNCGSSLAAGQNCTINVTFTPTAGGARVGAITITDDAPGSPRIVSLSGTGTAGPAVSLAPTSVNFPGNPLNLDCPSKDVTLTNTGDAPLAITSIVVSASFSETHTCGTSVAAGASCKISVKFHPPGLGTTAGTLTITSDAPGSPHTVALSGTGTPPCRLLLSARSATVLRGTDSTSFDVSDSSPSCSPLPLELSCSLQNPAACTLNPPSIPPSGSSTLKVSNLRAVVAEMVTVTVEAVSEFRRTAELLTVLISDFAFTRAPDRATVRAGESASYALAIRPVNGLQGTVKLSCGGAPRGATCTVTPAAIELDGSSLGQATVRVTTTARARGPMTQRFPPGFRTPKSLPMMLGLASLAILAIWTAHRRRPCLVLSVLLLVLGWVACGGGGLLPTSSASGTPAGTYTLTIRGSYTPPAGEVTVVHDTTVELTVN
jgi:hypothetical protein